MTAVTQLGYLGIGVGDVGAWERFATETLGLQVSGRDDDGSLFLRMDEHHHRFTVHPDGKDDLAYVGWQVADEGALRELGYQLQAAGVTVTPGTPEEATARRVAGLLKFHDPNGISSEVYYGPLIDARNPFQSPRAIGGFEAGTQGLGHIVIAVDDFDTSLHFYRDVLGMRISDFIRFEMGPGVPVTLAFFHCNPRHHSMAFVAAPLPKRLLHFMLQLKSLDDVGATYYQCQERGLQIASTLGRHTNDQMLSFYVVSPSGFDVEYGWGARTVDDSTWQVQTHEAPSTWGHQRLVHRSAAQAATAHS
jgi:2,3-dihydroxybiphenyl 1,2-dioxygenase